MHAQHRPSFTPDAAPQIRDTMRRVAGLPRESAVPAFVNAAGVPALCSTAVAGYAWPRVVVPKTDAAAWEDTEMDVRRVVL